MWCKRRLRLAASVLCEMLAGNRNALDCQRTYTNMLAYLNLTISNGSLRKNSQS